MTHPLPKTATLGLLLIRLMLAVVFVYHGSQKLFGVFDGSGITGFAGYLETLGIPYAHTSAFLAGAAEFFGGLALASGLYLRLLAVPLVFTMLVAAFGASGGKGFDSQKGGMEYPLTLAVVVMGVALIGPGTYTLGRRRVE